MNDTQKSRAELEAELAELRRQVSQLQLGLAKKGPGQFPNEPNYRRLLDQATDVISWIDADLRYVYINPAVEQATGLSASAWLGKTHRELGMPEPLCEIWDSALRQVFASGRNQELEFEFPSPTGFRAYQARLVPEFGPNQIVDRVLIISRDVTAQRQARQVLRESEQRFRKIFEEGPLGMALVALDYRFVKVNRRLCGLIGYSEAELTTLKFTDVTHPDDIDKDIDLAEALFQDKIPYYQMEKRYLKKDQGFVWIMLTASVVRDDAGQALYGLAMIEDISERKAAEAALHASEKKYRMLIDQAADGIMIFDEQGYCLEANSKSSLMLNYSQAELRQMHVRQVIVPADIEATPPRIEEIRKGQIVLSERRLWRKDGTEFDAEISSRMLPDRTIQSIIRDTTNRKRAEQEKKALIDQLQSALAQVKTLSGLLPICAACKNIRDDQGYWQQIEVYIRDRSTAEFSHSICPACARKLYPEFYG